MKVEEDMKQVGHVDKCLRTAGEAEGSFQGSLLKKKKKKELGWEQMARLRLNRLSHLHRPR